MNGGAGLQPPFAVVLGWLSCSCLELGSIGQSVCSLSWCYSSSGLHVRGAVCKTNWHPRIVLASSVFHLKPNEKWGKVCHTCLILFLSVTSVFFACVKKRDVKYEGGGFFLLFFFLSDFSVIYETMLLCFLTHLTPDQADLESHFHDSWLITSTAELGASMKGPWPPSQHLLRNSLCWVFLAEASPKVEGDSYLPKWEDNRRKNKDENLSSQLNLFRLIPAFGIQAAANPRFP